MFRKLLDERSCGDNIGALVRGVGVKKSSVARFLASPGRLRRTPSFRLKIYVLSKDEAAVTRRSLRNYRPQFYFPPLT